MSYPQLVGKTFYSSFHTVLLGVAFAAMVYNRKNILTSISMHMIHNVALILLSIATMAVILL